MSENSGKIHIGNKWAMFSNLNVCFILCLSGSSLST